MKRLLIMAAAPLALAWPAHAQGSHAGHAGAAQTPPQASQTPETRTPADPHAGHAAPADPHAGHTAAPAAPPGGPAPQTATPADPHAGHGAPADPHAGHASGPAAPPAGTAPPTAAPVDPHAGHAPEAATIGNEPPPPPPTDFAAERFFPASAMSSARAQLRKEHGDVTWSKLMLQMAEIRPQKGSDAYAWKAEASVGGDLNRFMVKTEGEGQSGSLENAELQALFSRAIGPYFDLQAGLRHDFKPGPQRTYATLGLEGVAPYWFEVESTLFLSDKGDVSARLEGSYDLRLTQKLVLEPRAEAIVAASKDPAVGVGAGVRSIELGLRLRYAVRQEFAPYVGVHWERRFGETADYARAAGEGVEDVHLVLGLRTWF